MQRNGLNTKHQNTLYSFWYSSTVKIESCINGEMETLCRYKEKSKKRWKWKMLRGKKCILIRLKIDKPAKAFDAQIKFTFVEYPYRIDHL